MVFMCGCAVIAFRAVVNTFLQEITISCLKASMLSDGWTEEVSMLVISTVGAEITRCSYLSSTLTLLSASSVTSLMLFSGNLALLSYIEVYAFLVILQCFPHNI